MGIKLDGPDVKMGHGLVRTSTLDVSLPQENTSASVTLHLVRSQEWPALRVPVDCGESAPGYLIYDLYSMTVGLSTLNIL